MEKTIETFTVEKKDIGDLVLGIQEGLYELGRNILSEVLEDMDEGICLWFYIQTMEVP